MGGGISDLIGFKLLFCFYVILFIVFDICSTYFIYNMLDVNRILKLYFILSENKKRNYYYLLFLSLLFKYFSAPGFQHSDGMVVFNPHCFMMTFGFNLHSTAGLFW